ncbi:MAG: precorrin-2 C(20)-methyltransferase [Desulfovibrionaceae bacterium]|nr:precorrin-2 C(20)-methyltransferase [Desulfovibrionaceae bacterium]
MNKNDSSRGIHSDCTPLPGVLYGIGVGPGAPDLLTLRAISVLQSVSIILAAASPKNDDSLALSIAAPHLPKHTQTVRLDFPMTRDKEALRAAWENNARTVATILRSGRDAAFLTLGDPLIYSTFGYLMRTLESFAPELPVRVIPGITSFQEAAAKTRTVLCEGEENLLVVSGINTPERLKAALSLADSAVILKTYRNAAAICEALAASGGNRETRFVSRLGLEGEIIAEGLDNVPEKPHYLSLILAPPRRKT